ncbi:MAG: integrase core domain-containing protein [Cypionkella sp.]|nr:integrase core domain-containing protein [Cypionkella sp.]
MKWSEHHEVAIQHIQPGQPRQNAWIERYRRAFRHEWLTNTSSKALAKRRTMPHDDCGLATPLAWSARTWASAASHPLRN